MNTAKGTGDRLVWTRHKHWGSVGMTYRAEVTVGGSDYWFAVDQPWKGEWAGRGWKADDPEYFNYRMARTAKGARQAMQDIVDNLVNEAKAVEQ